MLYNNQAIRKRTIKIDGKKYIIRKSRFKIDKDNYAYYTLLQLFSEIEENTKLDNLSKQRINSYIKKNKIEQKKLINLAMVFPAKTIKKLIGSGVLNLTAK